MNRALLLGVALLLLASLGDAAWAQEHLPQPSANPADTFPAALGYAVIAAVSTAGATMGAVIRHLWKRMGDQQKAIENLQKDHNKALEVCRVECRAEIDKVRDRLEIEQKERREESERLLREQKEIMREVMVTCSAISVSLEKNTEALVKLKTMIHQWGEGGEE